MAGDTTRTAHSYLAGIGASGALLACAVVGFLSLIGAVSVSVWPEPDASDRLEIVELQAPPVERADLAEAEDIVVSTQTAPGGPTGPDRGSADKPDGGTGPQGPGGQPSPPDEGDPPSLEEDDGGEESPQSGGGSGRDGDQTNHHQEDRDDDGGDDECDDDLLGDGHRDGFDDWGEGDGDDDWDGADPDDSREVDYVEPDDVSIDALEEPDED